MSLIMDGVSDVMAGSGSFVITDDPTLDPFSGGTKLYQQDGLILYVSVNSEYQYIVSNLKTFDSNISFELEDA